ncbi:MAG: response regulator, partial [Planctomycetes bacterium]|nr:response regulator [Planctomycetota bacterium]
HLGDERFTESSDSLRRAIIAAFSATDVVREIDEIGLLVERLGRERGVDNLANLRDNQLRLAHRRLDECLARHESPDMQALRAQVPALCRVLYGDGWRDDEAHECVVPGEGGLFRVRERWLELSAERDRIAELGATHLGVLDGRIGDLTRAIDELLLGVESAVRTETDAITTQWTIGGALAAALLFGASFALLRRVRSAVAELRASREAALEASRAKSAFVANISHEIRTPMNGVLGIAELLEHTPLNAEQRRFVGTIRSSGGALMSVLNDVLDFSKLDAQQMRLEAVSVSPAGLVEDVVALFGPKAEANGVTFEARVAAVVPPWVVGDPTRIRQVLFNLVGNAIKFTERGSIRVDVDATPIDGTARFRLRFTVVDTGPGIEPSTLERLFAPFAQSDDSTTRRFGGTGLGLVICRRLLDLMGGRITVESVPGEGSAFSVEVPCAVAPAAVSAPPRRTSIQASTPHAIDVLVVEDNAVNQMVVARMLAKLGARVHVVGDGAAAVAAITARAFDLVLMDCHMPGMDGFEATRRIRASEGGEVRTPIVALTASALDEDQRRCDDAGMDGFLGKPVTSDALAAALTRHARGGSGHDPRPVAGGGPTSPSSERP